MGTRFFFYENGLRSSRRLCCCLPDFFLSCGVLKLNICQTEDGQSVYTVWSLLDSVTVGNEASSCNHDSENPRTEFNGSSSNPLRRRFDNSEQKDQEERGSSLSENGSTTPEKGDKNGSTKPEKGTSQSCKVVALTATVGSISILIALYFSGYIHVPPYHSQENEIPPNLTSLSEEPKKDAIPPTNSSEELKENAIPLNFISLSNELQDIEEWSDICTYFGVKKFLENRIEDEYKTVKDRREKCLSAYLDSGRASWQHVVNVISKYPFYKCTLGKDIARKYHVSLPECTNDND